MQDQAFNISSMLYKIIYLFLGKGVNYNIITIKIKVTGIAKTVKK